MLDLTDVLQVTLSQMPIKNCSFNEVRLSNTCGDRSCTAFGRGSLPPVVCILVYVHVSNGQSISYKGVYGYVTFLRVV